MKNNIRTIKEGNIAKRLIAAIMDAVVFVFTFGCLITWAMVPLANKYLSYQDNTVMLQHYECFSELYVLKEFTIAEETRVIMPSEFTKIEPDSDTSLILLSNYETDDIEFYRSRIKYYYLNFKTNKNIQYDEALDNEVIKSRYYSPIYDTEKIEVNGVSYSCEEYYTEEWFNENYGPEKITTLKDIKIAANEAVADLRNSSYFDPVNNELKKAGLFIAIPPFVLCYGIYYVLIPLLFKNGETLGKKVCHLGFVTKDCYSIKRRQVVFRQILLFIWVALSMVFLTIDAMGSLATLGVGIVIYLVATLISKHKRSPVDYAAYTYLIDTRKSVWFPTKEIEEEKEQQFEEKMDKYRKVKVENKHLIQVGTTIIDEQVKKEFEEEKLKKTKK